MNQQEWQSKLDEMFPIGVQVTVLLPDDPTRFLAKNLDVLDVEDEIPTVCVYPLNVDKDFLFTIAELLELDEDLWVVTQKDEPLKVQLDTRFSPSQIS